MGAQVLQPDGTWADGKAAPELVAPQLRQLPSELVTSDVDDEHKVHESDAPHVLRTIVKDHNASEEAPPPPKPDEAVKKLWAPGPGERGPVTQWFVDVARMRVLLVRMIQACARAERGERPDLEVCHLRFPDPNNVNEYVLGRGPKPEKRDLAKHERDLDLDVDPMNPPRRMVAILRERGMDFDMRKLLAEAETNRNMQRLVHLV